jgi:hypothetical protein
MSGVATAAEWLRGEPECIAELNRAKSFRTERLRAEVRPLASDATATLRELVSGPDVPPPVRLRASLAILQAVDAVKVEPIGPMSADGVVAHRHASGRPIYLRSLKSRPSEYTDPSEEPSFLND